jgi:hypothetical protein
VNKLSEKLKAMSLGDIVDVEIAEDKLTLKFSKFGISTIEFNLKTEEQSFKCDFLKESIAFPHKPLKADMETKLASILEENGATVELS